jgi:GntR family transcriptional regulator of arabinose operon
MLKTTKKQKAVQEYILDRISSGMREGEMLPTVKELSESLNVSPMTVHKAVNLMTGDGILYKIQGKGTFVGKASSRPGNGLRLNNGKKVIAFISPYIHDDLFMMDITRGVMDGIDHNRFSLINKHVWVPKLKEEEVISEMATYANGMILLPLLTPKSKKRISELASGGYPIVFIDHYPLDIQCPSVCTDNEGAAFAATEHLYKMGHRNILHISSANGYSSTLSRQEGYRQFMIQHSLEAKIMETEGDLASLDKVFANKKNSWPTAILALFDGLAINIYHYLKKKGIKVPDDVSLMGFNDDAGMDLFEVPLTTMSQPKKQIGCKAAKLISDIIGSKSMNNSKYFLPATLVQRNSVRNFNQGLGVATGFKFPASGETYDLANSEKQNLNINGGVICAGN